MKRLSVLMLLAAQAVLGVPVTAVAGGTASGATRAVARAIAEEAVSPGFFQIEAHCRLIAPSRYGCSFRETVREEPYAGEAGPRGRVTVTYRHRHYYVGEPRFDPPPEAAA
jgi:hypothetical protein